MSISYCHNCNKYAETFRVGAKIRYFHGTLREQRLAQGLTQEEVAKRLGIGKASYGQIENLRKFPTEYQMEKLCEFFGAPREELFPEWAKMIFIDDRREVIKEIEVDRVMLGSPEILQLVAPDSPEEDYEKENLKQVMLGVLDTLNPREKKVLEIRFGLKNDAPKTLEESAKEFGVTRERIRQIEAKALRKLRHTCRSRKLKSFIITPKRGEDREVNNEYSTLF